MNKGYSDTFYTIPIGRQLQNIDAIALPAKNSSRRAFTRRRFFMVTSDFRVVALHPSTKRNNKISRISEP